METEDGAKISFHQPPQLHKNHIGVENQQRNRYFKVSLFSSEAPDLYSSTFASPIPLIPSILIG